MMLYRPMGLEELLLVYDSGLRRFPPRLPGQDTFYPVLGRDYARQIAQDWNASTGSLAGYVTAFELNELYAASFSVHQVGSRDHRELWVPATMLDQFCAQIQGQIRVIDAFFGSGFIGLVPERFSLRGKVAKAQFEALWGIYKFSLMDFHGEITANRRAVFAHYPYWAAGIEGDTLLGAAERVELLRAIQTAWVSAFPQLPLGLQSVGERR